MNMSTPLLPQTGGKPQKYKESAAQQFSLANPDKALTQYRKFAHEIWDEFIGPMPVDKFINTFMHTDTIHKLPEGYVDAFNHNTASGTGFEGRFVSISHLQTDHILIILYIL